MPSRTLYFDIIGRDRGAAAAVEKVGKQLLVFGAATGAAVGLAVKKFADFDAQMSQVQALSHGSADEMRQLADAALTMGQNIGFSATQVADAETELVKAGISLKNILGGALKGSLDLAAAGQIDVGQATEIATIALTQFNLAGKDVPHVADLLAAGADKALGGVGDLGEGLKSGGLIAAQFGVSLDETVGTLSAFANAGLLGETAGTGLRQMLLKLGAPSAAASKTMADLGINIYDTNGQFVGMAGLAGQLHDKMKDLDPATRNAAMATIFGAKAIQGANVLYAEGAKGIAKWTNEVNDQGFATEQARAKMDNLNGDVKKFGAAVDTALIKSGSGANDTLRGLTQSLTDVAKFVGGIPQPVLSAGLAVTALTSGAALLGGGLLVLIPKIEATRAAVVRLNTSMPGLAGGMSRATSVMRAVPFVVLGAEAANFTSQVVDSTRETLGLAQSVDTLKSKMSKGLNTKSIDDELNATVLGVKTNVDQLSQLTNSGWLSGAIKDASDFGATFNDWNPIFKVITGGAADVTSRVKDLDAAMAQTVKSGNVKQAAETWEYLKSKTDGSKEALAKLKDLFPQYEAAVKSAGNANDGSAKSTQTAAAAYQEAATNAEDLDNALNSLIDTVNKANGTGQDAVSANADYQSSLQGVKDKVKELQVSSDDLATSIDETTVQGSANAEMFAEMAGKSQAAAKAQFDIDHNTQSYTDTLNAGRQALYDQIFALTGNADAAQALTDKVYAIPSQKEINIIDNAANAKANLDALQARIDSLTDKKTIQIVQEIHTVLSQNTVVDGRGAGQASGGFWENGIQTFADGGFASGIYRGRPGGLIRFAEQETGWEAFISGKPGKEDRNRQVALAALDRLGGVPSTGSGALLSAMSKVNGIGTVPGSQFGSSPRPSASTVVEVRVTQKVTGVSLKELIDMEIKTSDGWQTLELSSGVGR